MNDQILSLLTAAVTGSLVSAVTGFLSRPKTRAEAGAAEASGQVAISGTALAWAQQFAAQATEASTKAEAAGRRVDDLENKLDACIQMIRSQNAEIIKLGGHPLDPPDILVPPLEKIARTI